MKTKSNATLCLLFVFLSFILSCRPEQECNETTTDHYSYLSDYNKANLYKGYDTLVFVSEDGNDTSVLFGQGKQFGFHSATSPMSPENCGVPAHRFNNEYVKLTFIGKGKLNMLEYNGYFASDEATEIKVNTLSPGPFGASYFHNSSNNQTIVTFSGINYNCFYFEWHPHFYFNSQFGFLKVDSINGKNWIIQKL